MVSESQLASDLRAVRQLTHEPDPTELPIDAERSDRERVRSRARAEQLAYYAEVHPESDPLAGAESRGGYQRGGDQ